MHKISAQMRQKLSALVTLDETPGSFVAHYQDGPRMLRKIPAKNYSDLSKLVPINWL